MPLSFWFPLTASSLRAVWLLGLPLLACSVTSLNEGERQIAVNACDPGADCAGGTCRAGMCVAATSSVSWLLFEVTPTSSAGAFASQPFLKFATVSVGKVELRLETLSLTGSLAWSSPDGVPADCIFLEPGGTKRVLTGKDRSIPARFTFTPTERQYGVPAPERSVVVDVASAIDGAAAESYDFELALPAGNYDLYVEPFEIQGTPQDQARCAVPPQLIANQAITRVAGKTGNTELQLKVPDLSLLELEIPAAVGAQSLDGWQLDMLEPNSGRVISTRARLLSSSLKSAVTYRAQLNYLPSLSKDGTPNGGELVRLTPPREVVAPVILIERSAVELFSKGSGTLDSLMQLPDAVTFEARVADESTDGVPASVTLTATRLEGIPEGTLASFVRRLDTREDGRFSLQLLPGTYSVQAVPNGVHEPPLAATRIDIEVAASPVKQSGRVIQLPAAVTLTGRVTTPGSSDGARGAIAAVERSAGSQVATLLERALGAVSPLPGGASTLIEDRRGLFSLASDLGVFDLFVRPPEGSNYPWLVMPNLTVSASNLARTLALDRMSLTLPVRLDTQAFLADSDDSLNILAGALVRAYAPLDKAGDLTYDSGTVHSAVAVAEGRLNERGGVELFIPAELKSAPIPLTSPE